MFAIYKEKDGKNAESNLAKSYKIFNTILDVPNNPLTSNY